MHTHSEEDESFQKAEQLNQKASLVSFSFSDRQHAGTFKRSFVKSPYCCSTALPLSQCARVCAYCTQTRREGNNSELLWDALSSYFLCVSVCVCERSASD